MVKLKKVSLILLLIIFEIIFAACGTNNANNNSSKSSTNITSNSNTDSTSDTNNHNNTNGNGNDNTNDAQNTSSTAITFTKEFSYLPAYPSMTLVSKSNTPKQGYLSAMYIVKSSQKDDVLSKYEKILSNHKWKTTTDKKPESIVVEKNNHIALIASVQNKNDTYINISAK